MWASLLTSKVAPVRAASATISESFISLSGMSPCRRSRLAISATMPRLTGIKLNIRKPQGSTSEANTRRARRRPTGVSSPSAFNTTSSMTVGVTMNSQAGSRRRIVAKASMTGSSSFARSNRTLVSTATSEFLRAPVGIDHLHPPMQKPLALLIGEGISRRASLLGQACAEGDGLSSRDVLSHKANIEAQGRRRQGQSIPPRPRKFKRVGSRIPEPLPSTCPGWGYAAGKVPRTGRISRSGTLAVPP